MKDWQRSPEPPSMMGFSTSSASSPPVQSSFQPQPEVNATTLSEEPPVIKHRTRTKVDTTLADMAKKKIMMNLHLYSTFGNTPFPIVRPILEHCTAEKLWALEEESPVSFCSTSEWGVGWLGIKFGKAHSLLLPFHSLASCSIFSSTLATSGRGCV
jgi:elongin-A